MHKMRAIGNGVMAEIFGELALPVDVFSRTVGYKHIAQKTWDKFEGENRALLQAYADGVNDYINNIRLDGKNKSSNLLPPEFIIMGIK